MRATRTMATFLLTLSITSPAVIAARGETVPEQNNVWSQEVNGVQALIGLKRSRILNGTPIISTYLVLRNVSDVMNPLTIPWDDKLMKFHVVDADGNDVPLANGPYDGMELSGTADLVLPFHGELSFDYSSTGLGVPGDKAALICLGPSNSWVLEPNQGDCFLRAILEVAEAKRPNGKPTRPWHGRIELPPVKVPVGAEQMDAATIEARVKELGPKMLDNDYRVAEEAEREMSLIDDPGVVEWYLRLLDVNQYDSKMRALDRLSRFDGNEAFEALKKAMATRGEDIGSATTREVGDGLAKNIRHSAAVALSRSPHPEAKPLLMTMWNHPARSVQITLLHVLGKMDTHESLELLRKMSRDDDKIVRDEALRYLKLRDGAEETSRFQ